MALSSATRGVLAVLAASILWGSGGVAAKFLMRDGLSPFVLTQGRMTAAAALWILWLLATRPGALKIRLKDAPYFALLGVCGLGAVSGCYLAALKHIQVAAAIPVQYLGPALIGLWAWMFMGERLTALRLIALGLAFAGCYLVVGGYSLDLLNLNRWGILWGLGAAATFAVYTLAGEYGLRTYSPHTVLGYGLIFAALAWSAALGPGGLLRLGRDPITWLAAVWLVVGGTIVPFGLMFFAIERVRATRASIIAFAEPVAGGALAYLLLGEVMAGWQILGGAAVAAAVILIQRDRETNELTPQMLKRRPGARRGPKA